MNNVNIIGRNVREVELRYIPNSGTAVANFTVAVDKGLNKQKKEEFESQGKPTADFINIVTWGGTAEYVANYLGKGKMIAVQGSIETGKYQAKEGHTVYTTDIRAFRVKILEWKNDNQGQTTDNDYISGFDEVSNENIPF